MPPKLNYLTTLSLADSLLAHEAHKLGCKTGCLRVLGLLSELDAALYRVTTTDLATGLQWHYNTAMFAVRECVARGWLLAAGQHNASFTLTSEGQRIAGILTRTEREARLRATKMQLKKKPRPYKRKVAE